MKKLLLPVLLLLTGAAFAQRSVSYEAANWKTFMLDTAINSTLKPLVNGSQIAAVKKAMSALDAAQLEKIRYWNAGSPSYRWNQVAPALLDFNSEVLLRTPSAWMNVAIYDATVLAWKEKLKYKSGAPAKHDHSIKPKVSSIDIYSFPSEHAATAAAAAYTLAYFFPAKADSIMGLAHDAAQSRINAGLAFPADIEAGWQLGEAVAQQIIHKASHDGSGIPYKGEVNKDPKKWTGNYPLGISLASFKTMMLRSPDQFRPGPPPSFESDMNELKNFKRNFKSNSLAYYWANNGPELWNDVAAEKMFEYRMADDAPAAARIYMLLHVGYRETAISVMDAKYAYWGIRPTQMDTSYKSLLVTPPFPGYPSGHAMGAATSASILSYFFPSDKKEFMKMAKDCADSRFYAGIHFRTDNEVATDMGNKLGNYLVDYWMKQ